MFCDFASSMPVTREPVGEVIVSDARSPAVCRMVLGAPVAISADAYIRAGRLYENNCTVCHGVAAVTGGVLPDLRRSPRLQDAVAWRRAVVDGELASLGMPRFGKYLTAEDAELVRAYVARQAAMLYAAESNR